MIKKYRKSYRIKKRKSIFSSRFFWFGILILILIGGLFYLAIFSSIFQIREIKISGNQKVSSEILENLIREKISQRVLFFSSQSIFLTHFNKINKTILEKFPQIAKVNLKRKFFDKLIVEIKERKLVAIFSHNENLFSLDREGVIFEQIEEPESKLLKVKNLTLKKNPKLGEKVIKEEILGQILEINSKLNENLKIEPVEISIVSEERINVKTSEGWEIYFNLKGDLNWQLTKLSLILKERVPPEKRKNLEYIDLRFEKVYIFPQGY